MDPYDLSGIALAETHDDFVTAIDQTLQFVECAPRYEHLLASGEHVLPDEVAYRQSVRVGGDHPQAVCLGPGLGNLRLRDDGPDDRGNGHDTYDDRLLIHLLLLVTAGSPPGGLLLPRSG
mgnify:CR=1 FL=1